MIKNKKNLKIILAAIFFLLTSILGIKGLSGEDNWICQNGEWIKHGQPTTPKPTDSCPEQKIAPTISNEKTYKVIRIIDGDTFEIESGEKVRLIGIDTPEIDEKDQTKKCWALKAMFKTKEMLEGKNIKMEQDISSTDKYQRLLRYVWIEDFFFNDYLVKNGLAWAVTYPPDVKYQEQFSESQRQARESKLGLWGEEPCQL